MEEIIGISQEKDDPGKKSTKKNFKIKSTPTHERRICGAMPSLLISAG